VSAVALEGDYAYVVSDGLMIVDISDPAAPTLAGSYDISGSVAVAGNYAYIAAGDDGLVILDVTDPSSPILAGIYVGSCDNVDVAGNYAYVTSGYYHIDPYGELKIIDISNPAAPTHVGECDAYGWPIDIAVSGNYAYLANGDDGLVILNVGDPDAPAIVGFYGGGYVSDVDVAGNHAYVNNLEVVDVSDPSDPFLSGSFDTEHVAYDIVVSGNYAYIAAGENGLVIMDISNPASPALMGTYVTTVVSNDVDVVGNYAYVADEINGLVIVDITNPSAPTFVGNCDTEYTNDIAVASNYAYISDVTNGLVIMDISNPSSPALTGSYDAYNAQDVDVAGNYAYLADTINGLVIVNISDPAAPTLTNSYDTGYAEGVDVAGNYAYIADSNNGLVIIDITDPAAPTLAGGYETTDYTSSVAVSGNYAYITDVNNGLVIVDITDPHSPTFKGSYYTDCCANHIAVSSKYAYITSASNLVIVDISNPSTPTFAGRYDTGGWINGVTVSDNYAYVADRDNGLVILRMEDAPTTITYTPDYDNRLRQSSPNSVLSSSNYIDIGRLGTTSYRDVMWFDLNGYTPSDTISKATLSLYWYYPSTARTSDTVVEIYRPVEWSPQYVTWNSRISGTPWTTAGGNWFDKNSVAQGTTPYASVTFPAGKVPDNKYYEFDVTQLVQEYVSGTTNTGFFLKAKTEGNNYIAFYSSEWPNAEQRPKLTITTTSVSVDNPPFAEAGPDQAATTGAAVTFNGSASADDKGLTTYSWDFDISDGIATDATGITATTSYATAGNYTVTLTVTDTAGQTDSDTLQVVVTSPVTTITVSYTPDYDNRLRQSTPNTVSSSSNYIDIGRLGTTSYRDVIWFDLSRYTPSDTISKATLSLYWYYPSTTRTSDTVVEVYKPEQWDPQYVCWNNRASGTPWVTAGGSWYDKNGIPQGSTPYASLTFPAGTVPDNKYYEFDVTQLVQEYVMGYKTNTGFFLKAKTEGNNYIAFYSSEWPNADQRPELTITSTSGTTPTDNPPVAEAGADKTATVGSKYNL
jgi:hypothetical protein